MRQLREICCDLNIQRLSLDLLYRPMKEGDCSEGGGKAPWCNQHPALGGNCQLCKKQLCICGGLRCQRILSSITTQVMSTRPKVRPLLNSKSHKDKTASNP